MDDAAQYRPVINPRLAVTLGKYGCRRAICSSFNQYNSLVHALLTEPEPDRDAYINASWP